MWWSFVGFDPRISCVAGRSSFPIFSPISIHKIFQILPRIWPLHAVFIHGSWARTSGPTSSDIRPGPDIRPSARTSGHQPGHPAPDSKISIPHSVYRLTLTKFCPGAHIHFRIPPPFPHSTTIAFPATNSDNFDPFCFENLSCGFCVLLCFGYLGTVRHRHHYRSSSPWTTTCDYTIVVSTSPWYHLGIVISSYTLAFALITP